MAVAPELMTIAAHAPSSTMLSARSWFVGNSVGEVVKYLRVVWDSYGGEISGCSTAGPRRQRRRGCVFHRGDGLEWIRGMESSEFREMG